jgi:hypothetical protein
MTKKEARAQKGGKARAAKLSAAKRKAIARMGYQAMVKKAREANGTD